MSLKRSIIVGSILLIIVLLRAKVNLDWTDDHEGLFLLHGQHGAWLEITDDLFPEDIDRFIYGHPFTALKHVFSKDTCTNTPCYDYEWNAATGRGFIKAIYSDGKILLICLSRFKDSDIKSSAGLFIGGNLPLSDKDSNIFNKNQTGMAFFDGKNYYHIWCNVNEGIYDNANNFIEPTSWKFIDSKVLESSATDLTLLSRHRTVINNVPIAIERYLFYEVGETYVTLVTKITNVGTTSTVFSYSYGDEPWVGDYGSSAGDVGWFEDGLVKTEMLIDTKKHSYAGYFDYGNDLANEKHTYTNQANFIEWQQVNRPDHAYFSNEFGKIAKPEEKKPLASSNNRVISVQWDKKRLQPNQSFIFKIAVGMATYNPKTNLPVKPDTGLER